MKAMELGAMDYVPKPTSSKELTGSGDFRQLLMSKVKALGAGLRQARKQPLPVASKEGPSAEAESAAPAKSLLSPTSPIQLRPANVTRPDVIAIGSSTGGPQALFNVLKAVRECGGVEQPIFITQHMPPTFTTILAEHIKRIAGLTAKEATEGEKITGGMVYIAPGDWHMLIQGSQGTARCIWFKQSRRTFAVRPWITCSARSLMCTARKCWHVC